MNRIIPVLLAFVCIAVIVSSGCTAPVDTFGCDPNSPDYEACMQGEETGLSGEEVDLPPLPPPSGSV
jgi:hypothetical protein